MADIPVTPSPPRRQPRLRSGLPLIALLIGAAVYAGILSYFSYLRFESFNSSINDLGFYNQLFWITLHGGPNAWATYAQTSFYASYPWQTSTFFLLVPVYAVFPSPVTLLVAQSIGISVATVPIYLLARKYGLSGWEGFALGGCYLLNFQVQSVNLNDFHLQAFYPLTFFSMVLFYEYGWRKLFLVAGVLSLATNPLTLVLTFFFLGAVLLRECSPGLSLSKLLHRTLDWLRAPNAFVILFVIGVAFGAFELWAGLVGAYHVGASSVQSGWPGYFSTGPNRAIFLIATFVPFLAVAFLVRETLVLMIPLAAFLALADISFFYPYIGRQDLLEFLVVALWGLLLYASRHREWHIPDRARRVLSRRRARRFRLPHSASPNLTVTTTIVTTAVCFIALSPLSPWNVIPRYVANLNETPSNILTVTPSDRFLSSAMALIPSNASVLTQNNIPQLTGRYAFQWAFPGKTPPNLTPVQFILSDQSSDHFAQVWYFYLRPYIETALGSGDFGILAIGYGVLLLERGYSGPPRLEGPLPYPATDMTLSSGYWQDGIAVHPPAFSLAFWYGPYVDLPAGNYTATFRVMIGPGTPSFAQVLDLAVTNQTGLNRTFHGLLPVDVGQFPGPYVWTDLTLNFTLTGFLVDAEFPGLWTSNAVTIYFGGVTVTVGPGFRS
ncbi:MAG TPA: DUF2079 domain-containing protein [Thermoplasmata archaeon]|nr:DUF2079 domain-containing protein [Thermoplasmata archaeon]